MDELVGGDKAINAIHLDRKDYWQRTELNDCLFEKGNLNELLAAIDDKLAKGSAMVAIDGRCASGKSTLAALLAKIYDCNVLHIDDFFLQPEQRTEQRLAIPGENIDHERFRKEILVPLSEGKPFQYRKFNCRTQTIEPPIEFQPKKLTIVEGAYCLHSELAGFYDLKICLDVEPQVQKKRLIKRNTPQMAERFFNEWIPLEEQYFATFPIYQNADMVLVLNYNA